ncbi:MAG TPA: ABC transporter permease [Ktedonobacterales bacterium]|jgi:ABC-2 type transport system permease protein|nr:ABC transporter permease [Ktedonobacterales bacterium]
MSTIFSLYIASLKEFVRDRATIFWTLAFPLIFIVLFGVIFGGNGSSSNYTVGLVNEDNGAASQQLEGAFKKFPSFKIETGNRAAELDKLKQGQVDMVIVIPAGLSQKVEQKQTATVQMYDDPSTGQADSQIKQSIVQAIVDGINKSATDTVPPLALETNSILSQQLTYVDFLVPGILAMALMQLGLFGTATPLVTLRQEQVLRRLGATPLPRWYLLASQVLLRLTIALVQTGLILALSVWVFNVQIQGNILALLGLVVLGAITFVSLGYLVAAISKTVDAANGITSAVNFPMMFLSGIFFPLAALPLFLTPIVRALPLTYLGDALRQIMTGGTPAFPMWIDLAVMVGWILVCSLLAVRLFKWE